jgi:hypothetical protein
MAKKWAKETPNPKKLPEHTGMLLGHKHLTKKKK